MYISSLHIPLVIVAFAAISVIVWWLCYEKGFDDGWDNCKEDSIVKQSGRVTLGRFNNKREAEKYLNSLKRCHTHTGRKFSMRKLDGVKAYEIIEFYKIQIFNPKE